MTDILYLYGFVPTESASPPEALAGIDDRPVRLMDVGAFLAASSPVDAGSYGSGVLETQLGNLAWVGKRGVEHERVVTWFSDHATIVPMRLFTLFSSEEALRQEAAARSQEVVDMLRRFRDLREWDLKISYDVAKLAEHVPSLSDEGSGLATEIAAAAPGRRYLLERKQEELTKRETPALARSLAAELLEAARPVADEVIELDVPTHREGLPVVLDAALLVRSERVQGLQDLLAERAPRLEAVGVHARLTGPWAAYRFVGERARG